MNKPKEGTEVVADEQKVIKTEQVSVDLDNGIVVYKTNAEDGTGFTLSIEGREVKAKADGGQIWFYAGSAIAENPAIRLL